MHAIVDICSPKLAPRVAGAGAVACSTVARARLFLRSKAAPKADLRISAFVFGRSLAARGLSTSRNQSASLSCPDKSLDESLPSFSQLRSCVCQPRECRQPQLFRRGRVIPVMRRSHRCLG